MGKSCSLRNCPSGSRADRARRTRLGLRQVSFFGIPKDNKVLRKWCRSLRTNLRSKDAVCELHFKPESIVKEDRTILFNGSVHVIPRLRYKLRDDAVPVMAIAIKQDIDEPIDRHDDCVGLADHSLAASTCSTVENAIDEHDRPGLVDDNLLKKCAVSQMSVDTSTNFSSNGKENVNEIVGLEDSYRGFADQQCNTYEFLDDLSNRTSAGSLADDDESLHSDVSVQYYERYRDDTSNVESEDSDDAPDNLFTMDNIIAYLRERPLPQLWCWVKNPKEKTSVVFIQIDAKTLQSRLHLVLHADLSVTARTPDGKVSAELQGTISSIGNLEKLLDEACT